MAGSDTAGKKSQLRSLFCHPLQRLVLRGKKLQLRSFVGQTKKLQLRQKKRLHLTFLPAGRPKPKIYQPYVCASWGDRRNQLGHRLGRLVGSQVDPMCCYMVGHQCKPLCNGLGMGEPNLRCSSPGHQHFPCKTCLLNFSGYACSWSGSCNRDSMISLCSPTCPPEFKIG